MLLLFPVIAWYDIITQQKQRVSCLLLFPVIAWYDIITSGIVESVTQLLFPVIAWYDIILARAWLLRLSCCSQLSLGMI